MLNFNRLDIIGHLGKDAVAKTFQSKNGEYRTLRFNVGVNHLTYTASGDKREHTEWFHTVQSFNKNEKGNYPEQFKYLWDNLSTGTPVHITGRLATRTFKDKDGEQSITELIVNGGGAIRVLASAGTSSSGEVMERGNSSSSGTEMKRDSADSSGEEMKREASSNAQPEQELEDAPF